MKYKLNTPFAWSVFAFVTLISIAYFLLPLNHLFTVSAWVTKVNISAGQLITSDLLVKTRVSTNNIYGSVQNPDALVGKMLVVNKEASSTIYWHELAVSCNRFCVTSSFK
ncbi:MULTISPECIES: SAF domain-containing protein [unclassified Colwellia]|uniref:SAF domain-containing protein n=1 Tax=unclassified Colwellia TaxID=196834 RepID=UPI0015F69F1D|nr:MULTISPECIES: SAF domain-containing protein [unclassified Colwellia]MBA6365253.1 SAF domain-containing protein [Colwellia sp. BRX8-8]MBA6350283.1 SAF domain-containing protein [Colwellia sp. BRX8-9]MBA6352523.1 SAF domain-containing protein [Colwellia sp. BRX9-1]MBA6356508.1 SAF domain-containing protein [Colwellia sp. BRX8-3]MBA6362052.1 SAF domain-containing protein [Colwellia sp. BRX8-6]